MPKRHLFRALCATLTTLLVIGLAGIPRPAAAITWYAKPCIGFDQCEDRGYGNGGYSAVYKKAHWNMYGGHNCTNYVAYRLGKRGVPQFTVPGRGNARYWGEHARNKGYAVDSSPRKGDVAWWYDNMGASGHVALVESVNLAAGTVVVASVMPVRRAGSELKISLRSGPSRSRGAAACAGSVRSPAMPRRGARARRATPRLPRRRPL